MSQLYKAKTCLTEVFSSFFDDEWAFSVFNRPYAHIESAERKLAFAWIKLNTRLVSAAKPDPDSI